MFCNLSAQPLNKVELICAKVTLGNGTVMAGWKVARTGELLKTGCHEGTYIPLYLKFNIKPILQYSNTLTHLMVFPELLLHKSI